MDVKEFYSREEVIGLLHASLECSVTSYSKLQPIFHKQMTEWIEARMDSPDYRTSNDWYERIPKEWGLTILDPDGWDLTD